MITGPKQPIGLLSFSSLAAAAAFCSAWIGGTALTLVQERALAAAAVVLVYLGFSGLVLERHRRRKHARRHVAETMWTGDPLHTAPPVLVAFASQTGFAEQIAWQTAKSLQSAGMPVHVLPLGQLDGDKLTAVKRALFLISTTGEGDAPDSAAGFARTTMSRSEPLPNLQFGLLSLGDSSYRNFCGFGRFFDGWLRQQQASPIFDPVEVDNGDEGALRHWQHHLRLLSGNADLADWSVPAYGRWRLSERRLLNAGSPGGPVFHLAFRPLDILPPWQAGDIAEIGPRNPPQDIARLLNALDWDRETTVTVDGETRLVGNILSESLLPHDAIKVWAGVSPQTVVSMLKPIPHREYSIASLASDGQLELLVRQMRHSDDRLGLGSGWLTDYAPIGGEIALRVRENRSFHAPADDRPLILIGNGTGMAGLRAHLKARAAAGHGRNWLLFGERTADYDFFYREEISDWQRTGILTRLDLAFSRDQPTRVYVQHKLLDAAAELHGWLTEGAAIYVCGSLDGMAAGVTAAIIEILGRDRYQKLVESGRCRRDVY